jgi:hypothetical protein
MRNSMIFGLAVGLVLTGTWAFGQTPAPRPAPVLIPATPLEQSFEHRFQMDYQVDAAALAKFLPAGFESAPAAAGAAKDCNLRIIFIDRINVVGPDNRPLGNGAERMVYFAAPVKETATGATGQIIIGGLTDNAGGVPGAFGNYLHATTAKMSRSVSADNGALTASESWEFRSAGGEQVRMQVAYTPAPANRSGGAAQTRFFDPRNPKQFQIFQTDQVTDILRNVTTTPPDRVKSYSLTAGGGRFASLFNGKEKPLSWDSQRSYVRNVSVPE